MSFGGFIRRTIFWHNDAKNNDGFIRGQYDQINRSLADPFYTKSLQDRYLAAMLEYMTTYSPYYSAFQGSLDLNSFPVMAKQDLITHHNEMAVDSSIIPHQKGNLYIQKTSGSTGVPFSMPQDTRKRQRRIAEIKAFSALDGYESHEPMAQCRVWTKWQSKTSKQAVRENIYPVNVLTVDDKSLANVCDLIKAKHIIAIRGYASWFTSFMNYLKNNTEMISSLRTLKVCITHSEALDEKTREYFQKDLGCNICECYANEENGILGQQKIGSHSYELNNTGYVFELLKLDSNEPAEFGELGRIVITDLHQRAFPVIRYDTGDTGIFSCISPELPLPRLEKLYGRKLDLVYDTKGKPIHPMSFNRILKNFDSIKQWQFAQTSKTTYELRIVASPEFTQSSCEKEIESFLGPNAQLQFVYQETIPVLKSGKHRSVVCEWKQS